MGKKGKARGSGGHKASPSSKVDATKDRMTNDEEGFISTLTNSQILELYRLVGEKSGSPNGVITPELSKEIMDMNPTQIKQSAESLKVLSSILIFDFYPTMVLILEGIDEGLQDRTNGSLSTENQGNFDEGLVELLHRHQRALEHVKELAEEQRTLEALIFCVDLDRIPEIPGWFNDIYIEPRLAKLDELAADVAANLESANTEDGDHAPVGSMLNRNSKV